MVVLLCVCVCVGGAAAPNDKCRKLQTVKKDFKVGNEGRDRGKDGEQRRAERVRAHSRFRLSEDISFCD